MSINFGEARKAVKAELGLSSEAQGYEDELDYNVLVNPPLDDEVVLVTKEEGTVHREVYFAVEDKLTHMLPVSDGSPLDPAPRLA